MQKPDAGRHLATSATPLGAAIERKRNRRSREERRELWLSRTGKLVSFISSPSGDRKAGGCARRHRASRCQDRGRRLSDRRPAKYFLAGHQEVNRHPETPAERKEAKATERKKNPPRTCHGRRKKNVLAENPCIR